MAQITTYAVMTHPATSGVTFEYVGGPAPIQWMNLPPGKLADILALLRHPNAQYNPTQQHLYTANVPAVPNHAIHATYA